MLVAEIVLEAISSNTCGNRENYEEIGSCEVLPYSFELELDVMSLKIMDVELNMEFFRWINLDSYTY